MRKAAPIGVLTCLFVLLAVASAQGAWRWSRSFQYQGARSTARGQTCSASRFSNWSWHARAYIHGDVYTFSWTEPIRRDGRYRHLNYTNVRSTAWSHLSDQVRSYIRRAVITELNKTRVAWFDQIPGHEYVEYLLPGHQTHPQRWQPRPGHC